MPSTCQWSSLCPPTKVAIAHCRVREAPVRLLHVAERRERSEQRLGPERVEFERLRELLGGGRSLVQRLEHAEHDGRRKGPGGDETGEGLEVGIRLAAIQHEPAH
jgi:hypothetical protein